MKYEMWKLCLICSSFNWDWGYCMLDKCKLEGD